jgi:hypothetical protein
MKTFLAIMAMGAGSVYAQKSSIDSPHNYKRPVFQQHKALTKSNAIQISSQSDYKIQNNLSSVHNYKRQGTANFAFESALVISRPSSSPMQLNPILSSSNYKSHFHTTEFGRLIALRNIQSKLMQSKGKTITSTKQ